MSVAMPDEVRKLLEDDYDGKHVLVNTEEGRQKPKNLRRDARVALSVTDARNPYKWAQIRGRVVELTHEGAEAHIDKLAKEYLGADTYPYRQPDKARIILKIEPDYVSMG